jgi:hypothetical protein
MAKKKKKVTVYKMPKAQEGMQMAEQAPQQQGGGQDQMQQIAMQVQQMLEQGADPGQVIAQLLQGGVPPEVIAQIFVGLGMPQEQVAPMIEQVMQQMQGAQQQAPPQGQPMMQGGGEAEQQAMMQEYIIVFAAMNQADPQEIMQAIESGQLDFAQIQKVVESPEGQEAAMQLQQMAQAQQGAGPQQQVMKGGGMVPMGYHTMPDGSIMADSDHKDDGGMVTEVMMGAINPTKKDFLKLKKKMLKEYKGGGTTPKGFDSSNTEAYVQNLQGAIANHVSKNLRVGIINQQFDNVIKQFDALPKAQEGQDTQISDARGNTRMVTADEAQSWYSALEGNPDISFTDLGFASDSPTKAKDSPAYDSSDGTQGYDNIRSATPGVIDPDTGRPMSWEQLDAIGGWKGFTDKYGDPKYYSASNQGAKHYYEGHGPGQRSLGGRYFDQRFDKTPLADMFSAFTKQGTGRYNIEGHGELAGAGVGQIGDKMAEISADPSKYNFRVSHGYLNRRGKMKKRPGLFGRPEAVQFDYVGQQGTPTVDGEAEDVTDLTYDPNQDAMVNAAGLSPYAGTRAYSDDYSLNEAPEGSMLYTDPITGEQTVVSPEEAARLTAEGGQSWQDFQVDPRWSMTPENSTEVTANGNQATAGEDSYRQMLEQSIADGTATRKERKAYKDVYGKEAAKQQKLAQDPYYGKTAEEIRQLESDPKKAEKLIKKYDAKEVSVGYGDNTYGAEVDATYDTALSNLTSRGISNPTQEQINAELDNVEMVRGMSGVPQGEMQPENWMQDYAYGGSVSQPGRPIWDFKQMRFVNGPKSSLLFAKTGEYVNLPDKEEMEGYSVDPTGSARIVEEQERTRDWKKFGQGAFDALGWLTDKAEAVQQTAPTWETTANRQAMIAPTDIQSGAMGFVNQWGDPRFGKTGQVGAGVRAGTGSDADVYGQFSQQVLQGDLYPGQTRWGTFQNGGLVRAQLGLEIGQELELNENDIKELQKYGYHITRM